MNSLKTLDKALDDVLEDAYRSLLDVADAVFALRAVLTLISLKQLSDGKSAGGRDVKRFMMNAPSPPATGWSFSFSYNLAPELDRACQEAAVLYPGTTDTFDLNFEALENREGPRGTEVLWQAISALSRIDLSEVEHERLARACERLLNGAVAVTKGELAVTERSVNDLMVRLLRPEQGSSIYDPACGTGGTLLRAALYRSEVGGALDDITLHGQEKQPHLLAIARLLMLVCGFNRFDFRGKDTLTEPQFLSDRRVVEFDAVLTEPPYGLVKWNSDGNYSTIDYPSSRFLYGMAPNSSADFAFVQHALASTKIGGRACVALHQGPLFRQGREAAIRGRMLDDDVVEAVIGLPAGVLHQTSLPGAILVLNRCKEARRRGTVLFVNAGHGHRKGRNKQSLQPGEIDRVIDVFDRYSPSENFSAIVGREVISSNRQDWSISLYVGGQERGDSLDAATERAQLQSLELECQRAWFEVDSLLEELGLP